MQVRQRVRRNLWRGVLASVALIGATATVSSTSTETSSADTSQVPNVGTVSFTVNPGTLANLTEFAGIDMGMFKKFGITAKPINSTSINVTMQLLETGRLQFASTNIATTIQAQQTSKIPMRVVVGLVHANPGALVCRTNDGIPNGYQKGMPALVGKTIALSAPNQATTSTVLLGLAEFHIKPSQVHIVYISGSSSEVGALDAKAVDCAYLSQPAPLILGNKVVTVLNIVQKGEAPAIAAQGGLSELTVTADFAASHPAAIKAMQKAITYIDNYLGNPKNASTVATAVAKDFSGYSHDQLTHFIKNIASTFKGAGPITRPDFAASLQVFNKTAYFTGAKPITNASYGQYVLKQLAP